MILINRLCDGAVTQRFGRPAEAIKAVSIPHVDTLLGKPMTAWDTPHCPFRPLWLSHRAPITHILHQDHPFRHFGREHRRYTVAPLYWILDVAEESNTTTSSSWIPTRSIGHRLGSRKSAISQIVTCVTTSTPAKTRLISSALIWSVLRRRGSLLVRTYIGDSDGQGKPPQRCGIGALCPPATCRTAANM